MKESRVSKKEVIAIALITAICLLGDSMLYVVLPIHFKEAGITSLVEVGLLLSVNRIVRLPLNPIVSWLYRKINMRTGMLLSVLLAGLTTAGYGLAKGFLAWLVLRCIWGIAWSFLRIGSYFSILSLSTEGTRGQMMGIFNGLYRLGSFFGMLVGGIAVDLYGLNRVSIVFAILSVGAVPLVTRLASVSFSQEADSSHSLLDDLVRSRKTKGFLLMLTSGVILAMIYQGVFTSSLSLTIQKSIPNGVGIIGITIGAASVAGVLQSMRWAWEPFLAPWVGMMSDKKWGRVTFLFITLGVASVLFWLLPVSMPASFSFVILVAIQITATLLTTLMDTVASDIASAKSKIVTMSIYSSMVDLGAALGPFAAFLIGATVSYKSASLALLCLACAWLQGFKHARVADTTIR